jgi:hypothetical protein
MVIMSYVSGYSIGKRSTDTLKTIDSLLDDRIRVNPENHDLVPTTIKEFQEIQALLLVKSLLKQAK